jgi:hypothetical protein
MPRPWFSKSGLSLCRSTTVPISDIEEAWTTSTCAPAVELGCTLAVLSLGSGGVMKRET